MGKSFDFCCININLQCNGYFLLFSLCCAINQLSRRNARLIFKCRVSLYIHQPCRHIHVIGYVPFPAFVCVNHCRIHRILLDRNRRVDRVILIFRQCAARSQQAADCQKQSHRFSHGESPFHVSVCFPSFWTWFVRTNHSRSLISVYKYNTARFNSISAWIIAQHAIIYLLYLCRLQSNMFWSDVFSKSQLLE